MTQPEVSPAVTTENTGEKPKPSPVKSRRGRPENLVRYPKGHQPAHLAALRDDPERVLVTKRTLMAELTRILHKKDGQKLAELAESIVDNAIKGNSACLSFLAERLAPIEEKQGGGRVVFEGIKLEVVSSSGSPASLGDHQTRTSIALVRGSESHSGATPLDVSATPLDAPNTSLAETEQVAQEGVILEQRDVRSPKTPA